MSATEPAPEIPQPELRWYQYRLRTLLLATAAIALMLGFGTEIVEWDREADVLHKVEFSGRSQVEYRWGRIVHLDLRENKFRLDDSQMRYIKGLRKLERLEVDGLITDAGVEELMQMSQLKTVKLCDTKVTDSGLAKLRAALPECRIEKLP